MGRIAAAVIAGYLLIGVLVFSTDQLFGVLIPGFKSMTMPPLPYFLISLGTDFVDSVIGGYVCSLIARERRKAAMWGLILMGEAIGVVTQVMLWRTVPHWFGIGLLVLYPVAVWVGSDLQGRQVQEVV
jgi:hypothetical protein